MTLKKISWIFKRHPFLYLIRFRLLSKNSSIEEIEHYSYNDQNKDSDIHDYFNEVNDIIFKEEKPTNDIELVKQLSTWLQNNIKGGPGLSEPSDEALRIMLAGKGGVCSDMAQVFNNFSIINNIKVREWGNTRAPFNRSYGGHSFNEFYSNELNKWILIDVSNSLFFYRDGQRVPLSVIELYELLRAGKKVYFDTFNPEKEVNDVVIKRNYLDPDTVPFLICNYSNRVYDSFLRRAKPFIPIFAIHFMLFLLGKSYHYRFPFGDYKKVFS